MASKVLRGLSHGCTPRDGRTSTVGAGGGCGRTVLDVDLRDLNDAPVDGFVEALGGIFEHSPWVARAVADLRPFADIGSLHAAMVEAVRVAGETAHLDLIRAHPDLGTRLKLSDSSTAEQASVGLDQLSHDEFARFTELNERYRERFGFPFIIAVRDNSRAQILEAFVRRIGNDRESEVSTALTQIARIARIRLDQAITN
jgi:2-oxo-4-hydroxy-4-carboxy-5-ureidoimidazoline decarboxylase